MSVSIWSVKDLCRLSAGKESACNEGDPGSIPGWGRSAGEGVGYPFQYSWASLVAQLVKNPPAMQETPVWFLGGGDPLENGKATHSSILAWRIPWTVVHGVAKSRTWLGKFHFSPSSRGSLVPFCYFHLKLNLMNRVGSGNCNCFILLRWTKCSDT